jgi:hypothetical protein
MNNIIDAIIKGSFPDIRKFIDNNIEPTDEIFKTACKYKNIHMIKYCLDFKIIPINEHLKLFISNLYLRRNYYKNLFYEITNDDKNDDKCDFSINYKTKDFDDPKTRKYYNNKVMEVIDMFEIMNCKMTYDNFFSLTPEHIYVLDINKYDFVLDDRFRKRCMDNEFYPPYFQANDETLLLECKKEHNYKKIKELTKKNKSNN